MTCPLCGKNTEQYHVQDIREIVKEQEEKKRSMLDMLLQEYLK